MTATATDLDRVTLIGQCRTRADRFKRRATQLQTFLDECRRNKRPPADERTTRELIMAYTLAAKAEESLETAVRALWRI